ncbi:MAG TPA: FG-GAP repeat protein, partial [Planctomycetota bacterium]|nr:FG-GAP repeat protein [Planctomycetota bacterium]
MRVFLQAMLLGLALSTALCAQSQPLLQLQGQPYFGGNMSLHLAGPVGQPALLAYGLEPLPLDEPIQTSKGAWYIGSLVNLVAIGFIPAAGRIDLPFTMPPTTPALAGIPIVMQGYVPSQLSNPATLPLDLPYLLASNARMITSPQPQVQAMFGDTLAVGDLNGDGHDDLIVGAWFEDWQGVDKSGRAYVFWGPDFDQWVGLQ